jgi:hypothetical protein
MAEYEINEEEVKEVSDQFDETLFQAILDKSSNSNYDYNDETLRYIYTNTLEESGKNTNTPYGLVYDFNENGYRSNSFKAGTDMLVTGCSFTFGSGIPTELRWGDILSKNLNLSYSNMAMPGSSVTRQVRDIFAYFKEFGHPKYIFAMFPVFNRMEIISNPKYLIPGAWERSIKRKKKYKALSTVDLYRQTCNVNMAPREQKFLTQPLIFEDIMPSEIPQFYSSLHVSMLQQYCDLAGIKLIWSTWHDPQNKVLNLVNQEYPDTYRGMVDTNPGGWSFNKKTNESEYRENNVLINCHEDYKIISEDMFHTARDIEFGIEWAHWGTHRHLHVAEAFEKYFKENIQND